jgi:hypothetical protein
VFPGSNESGVLLMAKLSVPPLALEGFTTLVRPALNAGDAPDPDDPPGVPVPQAASARTPVNAPAATASLRFLI